MFRTSPRRSQMNNNPAQASQMSSGQVKTGLLGNGHAAVRH